MLDGVRYATRRHTHTQNYCGGNISVARVARGSCVAARDEAPLNERRRKRIKKRTISKILFLTVGEGVVNRSNRLYGAESFVTYVLASSERRRQKWFNTESVAKVNGRREKKRKKKQFVKKLRATITLTDIVLCFGRSRARLHAGRELRCRRTSIMLRAVRQSDH